MLKKVDGKWAIVSKSKGKPLVYYKGVGKPSEEWVEKEERRIQYFKNKKEETMKTYKDFTEGMMSWKDIKNRDLKKTGYKKKEKLKGKEVLAYSAEHGEFSKFKDEKELEKAMRVTGKKMKWIKVESLEEAFNFKSAVKNGFLDPPDEKYVKELKKKGWEIDEFNITSKGFEITVINKRKVKKTFTDKRPELALKTAAQKSKR